LTPRVDGQTLRITLRHPGQFVLDLGDMAVLIFANPLETDVPDPADEHVRAYGPGLHDLEGADLALRSGEHLHLAEGAYLANGRSLVINDAAHVRVSGRGILAGNLRINNSHHVALEGITIHPQQRSWMNRIDSSQHITFRNYKALAGDDRVVNYDGFDIMSGCVDICMDKVFVRATDDCLTVKHHPKSRGYWGSKAPSSHIAMREAVLWNLQGGTAFRAGPETIGTRIAHVTMQDIDVLEARSGFEVLPVDCALLTHFAFKDIRVEACEQDLVHVKACRWYKVGRAWGKVSHITLKDWHIAPGVDGWVIEEQEGAPPFAEVRIDNIRCQGRPVRPDGAYPGTVACNTGRSPSVEPQAPSLRAVSAIRLPDNRCVAYLSFSGILDCCSAEAVDNYRLSGGKVIKAELDPQLEQVILLVDLSEAAERGPVTLSVHELQAIGLPAMDMSLSLQLRPAWTTDSITMGWQGTGGWWAEQFNPSEKQLYNNREDILSRPQYWLMDRTPDREGWISHDGATTMGQGRMAAGPEMDAVLTWRAPVAGSVAVRGSVRNLSGTSPAHCEIRFNREGNDRQAEDDLLWEATLDGTHEAMFKTETVVKPGSVLRFRLKGDAALPAVGWQPAIAYQKYCQWLNEKNDGYPEWR
jgi:hypothetical protein